MRIWKHGSDVKMFCFSRDNHASTNLNHVFELKIRQVYFTCPFLCRLKRVKSLQTCCANLFSLKLTFYVRKIFILEGNFFAKQELITQARRRVQDFATGKNLSFNQCHNKEFRVYLGRVNL